MRLDYIYFRLCSEANLLPSPSLPGFSHHHQRRLSPSSPMHARAHTHACSLHGFSLACLFTGSTLKHPSRLLQICLFLCLPGPHRPPLSAPSFFPVLRAPRRWRRAGPVPAGLCGWSEVRSWTLFGFHRNPLEGFAPGSDATQFVF